MSCLLQKEVLAFGSFFQVYMLTLLSGCLLPTEMAPEGEGHQYLPKEMIRSVHHKELLSKMDIKYKVVENHNA